MRIGPKIGVDTGVQVGLTRGAAAVPVTWTVDATSGVAMPVDATEYADWRAAYSVAVAVPSALFPCDEGSGGLADSIGARTAVPTGSFTYAHALAGWATPGVKSNNGTSWFEWAGVDLSVTDAALFAIYEPGTAGVTSIISLGGSSLATSTELGSIITGALQARRAAAVAAGSVPAGVVAVFIVCRQSASELSIYIKPVGGAVETLTPAWSAPPAAAQTIYLFNGYEASGSDGAVNRVESWTGADANITAAQVAAFFTARGI